MTNRNRLLSYLKPSKRRILLAVVMVIVFLVAQLIGPYLIGLSLNAIVDINLTFHPEGIPILIRYSLVTLGLQIVGVFADFVFEYSVGYLTQEVVARIRNDVFHKYNSIAVKDLDSDKFGNLVQYEIQDVENIANGLYSVFRQLIQGVLAALITLILMLTVNWILAIGVIVLTPLSILMSRFVATFSHRYFKTQAKLMGDLNSLSLESIENADIIRSLNAQEGQKKAFRNQDEALRKEGKIAQFSASWTNPSTRFVNNTIYAIIGISGIIMIIATTTFTQNNPTAGLPIYAMTLGALSAFLTYTTEYTKPFNEISSVLSEYETASYSLQRINAFLGKGDDIDDGTQKLSGPIDTISFEDMSFAYEPNQHLIEHFSETIHKGEKIAIVGPTGAGKTTLINVLMRFYDPVSGRIAVNGVDARDISKDDLRENFGMVLQDTWIFTGTVLENVRYAKPEATDTEVKEACVKANADSFIQTLPQGYQTMISSKGGLSEGERQLLTIARVMLKDPHIVILDEATSNVDTRTEKKIGEAFDSILAGRTSIVIAHRLSTIQQADCILVLKDGNIVEKGNHETLMARKGLYYSLYSSQFQ